MRTKEDLLTINEIIINAEKMAKDGYYMLNTSSIKFDVINRSIFLRKIRDGFYPSAIIELSQIFGNNPTNDHYSIVLLIREFITNYNTSPWNNNITQQELETFIDRINNETSKIVKMKKLRNKHYAHKDKGQTHPYTVGFSYEADLFVLIELAKEIVGELLEKVLEQPAEPFVYNGEEISDFMAEYLELIEKAGKYNIQLTN